MSSNSTAGGSSGGSPETLGPTVLACTSIMLFLSISAVALRFYTRCILMRVVGLEDWCMLVGLAFCIATTSMIIAQVHFAMGKHIWDVPASQIIPYLRVSVLSGIPYHLSLAFTKISILLLYLRVLVTYDYIRKLIWITLILVAVYNTFTFIMHLNICTPLAKAWDRSVPGKCSDARLWWAIIYMHIITDFIIFTIPVPVVVRMTIPLRQKVALLIVFVMGLFVCLISVLRTIWLRALLYSKDPTWDNVSISNWTAVEINIAVVCACLPTLKPLATPLLAWFSSLGLLCGKRGANNTSDNSNAPENAGDQPGDKKKRKGGADALVAGGIQDSTRPPTIGSMPLKALQAARGGGNNIMTDGTAGLSSMCDSDAGRGEMVSGVGSDEAALWDGHSPGIVANDGKSSYGGSSSAVDQVYEIADPPKAHVKGKDASDIV